MSDEDVHAEEAANQGGRNHPVRARRGPTRMPPRMPPVAEGSRSPHSAEPAAPAAAEAPKRLAEQPTPASTVGAQPQVIYVSQPAPPARKGNRGFGVGIALLSTVLFAPRVRARECLIGFAVNGEFTFDLPGSGTLLRAGAAVRGRVPGTGASSRNRASWWGLHRGQASSSACSCTSAPSASGCSRPASSRIRGAASELFAFQLINPSTIVAGLLAREISMWVGAAISRRGPHGPGAQRGGTHRVRARPRGEEGRA